MSCLRAVTALLLLQSFASLGLAANLLVDSSIVGHRVTGDRKNLNFGATSTGSSSLFESSPIDISGYQITTLKPRNNGNSPTSTGSTKVRVKLGTAQVGDLGTVDFGGGAVGTYFEEEGRAALSGSDGTAKVNGFLLVAPNFNEWKFALLDAPTNTFFHFTLVGFNDQLQFFSEGEEKPATSLRLDFSSDSHDSFYQLAPPPAVPEPSTLVIVGAAVGAIVVRRKRSAGRSVPVVSA
jgi:hypothetical protein